MAEGRISYALRRSDSGLIGVNPVDPRERIIPFGDVLTKSYSVPDLAAHVTSHNSYRPLYPSDYTPNFTHNYRNPDVGPVRYYGYNRYNYFKSPRYYNSPFAVLRYWYNSAFPFRYSKDYNPSYTNYHRHLFGRVLQADRSKSLFVNDKSPYGLHHGTYDRLDRNPYFPHGPYVIDRYGH